MHPFISEIPDGLPEKFTNPFRYSPNPLVVKAAEEVMARIDANPELRNAFSEGKMLGILLVRIPDSPSHIIPDLTRNPLPRHSIGYLAAFSGSVGGKSTIEGFVPPIFDLLDPTGHFKIREAEITAINNHIKSLENSSKLASLRSELYDAERDRDEEIGLLKAGMAIAKRERDEIRCEVSDPGRLAELIRESQHDKAELRRLKLSWEERIRTIKEELESLMDDIEVLKGKRAKMSDELQEWIFEQYIVHNSSGEESSIAKIFADRGIVPPGGTGDCAAPKLLEYAFRNGLNPIAMGEFWYGKSPETAVRTHGHFYPSCTSKCGPLLGWMLRGMDLTPDLGCVEDEIRTIYEDDVLIAVNKPSGMPSVPGLDGRESAHEILSRKYGELHAVHRLDMDTSGILLFAKTHEAAVEIRKQFEAQTVIKTYRARLSASKTSPELKTGDKGRIELPLSPDYDERPRQKVDFKQGKPAITDYEVISANSDGTTDILFRPLTGRTHQLRVHSAHTLGLGRPILGDLLYGGGLASRLYLHARSINFRHPSTKREVCILLPVYPEERLLNTRKEVSPLDQPL